MLNPSGVSDRLRAIVLVSTLVAGVHPGHALGQEAPAVFRSSTDLAVVQVAVFAEDGGPAPGLAAEDFHLIVDGRPQPISVFISPESGPLEIALLIDGSASMNRWPVRQAVLALLDSLGAVAPGACVLAMPFREAVHPGIWGHPDNAAIRSLITRLRLAEGTAVYDALSHGVGVLRSRAVAGGATTTGTSIADLAKFRTPLSRDWPAPTVPPQGECTPERTTGGDNGESTPTRRAVVLFTDGQDYSNQYSAEDVILQVWGARIPIFAFVASVSSGDAVDAMRDARWKRPAVRALERLAQYSGGVVFERTFFRRHLRGVQQWDAIERIVNAINGHYTLGFVPATAADPSLLVDTLKVDVHVPAGYEALLAENLAVGSGVSYSAALHAALAGFERLSTGSSEEALAAFERSAMLYAEFGMAYYGQSLALVALGRPEEALRALDVAGHQTPWIPDLDARRAVLLLQTGDIDGAWEYALRAHAAGSEVSDLIAALQARAPREVDLDAIRRGASPRIALGDYLGATTLASLIAPRLFAGIGRAVEESPELLLSLYRNAQFVVSLNLREAEHVDGRNEVSGEVVLRRSDVQEPLGGVLGSLPFALRDISSDEELALFGARVVGWIQREVGR